ncbi:hypothetical protein AVEN_29469-1 [Araneus ventricosus]|uniref:Uncharacterized protein n=1 Tax=Araneus ventricosus TaxID=182803 RepID=A0A4Y2L497_ARAVE|nr:hypothetical protein AVEN_29469-1 [Araneus ventricosus]
MVTGIPQDRALKPSAGSFEERQISLVVWEGGRDSNCLAVLYLCQTKHRGNEGKEQKKFKTKPSAAYLRKETSDSAQSICVRLYAYRDFPDASRAKLALDSALQKIRQVVAKLM